MNKNLLFKVSSLCSQYFKATFIVLVSTIMVSQAYAGELSLLQQKNVTLNVSNKTLKHILNQIHQQTNIDFMIERDIDKSPELQSMNIKVTNKTVEAVLTQLLKPTSFTYEFDGKGIVIVKKSAKSKDKITITITKKPTFMVQGIVTDSDDAKPIAGVSVVRKGYGTGSSTDKEGHFVVAAALNDTLDISYMGKISQQVVVKNENKLNIVLKADAMAIDDVLVMGFSTVKRSNYTGNAVTVNQGDILKVSKTNVIKALQAFDPSFRIQENTRWGSDPNALPEVNIRGGSSLGQRQASFGADGKMERMDLSKSNLQNNPNLPTFIMDGFEINVQKLYDYDPNRIESITILKDAAATALYGSRAANGVVIITTVAPKPGKINVAYNFVGDVTMPDLSDYNLLNAAEKLEVERLGGCYDVIPGQHSTGQEEYKATQLKQEYNAKLANVRKGVDTYWLSKPLRSVFNHKHSLYVDGGTDNLRFGMDVNYTNQDGVMKGSYRDRMGAGFYVQYTYKGLSVRNYTSYNYTAAQESPYGNFSDFASQLPYDTYLNDDGSVKPYLREWSGESVESGKSKKLNPMYEPSLGNFDRARQENLVNNFVVNWYLTNGIMWKTQFSIQKDYSNNQRFLDPLSMQNSRPLSETQLSSGELTMNYSDAFSYDLNTTLSFNEKIGKNMINALVGYQMMQNNNSGHSAFYRGFPSGALSSPNYAQEQVSKTSYSDGKTRKVGFLASLNYSYNDIYLLDASFRLDGSSSFGSNKRFAPFWSAGVGINIHKYNFMKDVKFINVLKLRGSYGQVGNANFSPWESFITYEIMSDEWYKTGYGATLKAYGNKNLKWETTNTLDFGIETSMFNNVVYLKASYYDKKTVDLINDVTIPISTGFTSYKDNVGEISNRGFEIDFRITAIKRNDMALYFTANLAHNKNKILKISDSMKEYNRKIQDRFNKAYTNDPETASPLLQYEEGGSLKSIWGVQSMGINPVDGTEVFIQRDGRRSQKWNAADQIIIGNAEPDAQGTFGINFTYKQFSIYTSFMYEFGGDRFNQTLMDKVENVDLYRKNVDKRVLEERWKTFGDVAKYKKLNEGRINLNYSRPSSRFIQQYNVLSWNSVEVSYDLPKSVTNKLHVGMLRFSMGMNDILHLSTVKQERGLSYPYARGFNFSLKTSF